MSLLSMSKQVARETGVNVPSTIIGNNESTARRLLACAQAAGRVLGQENLADLRKEHTFTTVASTQEYAVPSDFRDIIDDTFWDRTNNFQVLGSLTPKEWQVLQSGTIATTNFRKRYTIKQSAISNAKAVFFDPTPSAADSIAYEYYSDCWCQSSGGTGQTAWAADDDTGVIEEYLIERGLLWRFLRALGFAYADERLEYESELEKYIGKDVGSTSINLATTGEASIFVNLEEGDYTL